MRKPNQPPRAAFFLSRLKTIPAGAIRTSRGLYLCLCLCLLTACSSAPSGALPTALSQATVPAATNTSTPGPAGTPLPPTWTPLPGVTVTSGGATPLAATSFPTPTGLIPSRTATPTPTATATFTSTATATVDLGTLVTLYPPSDDLGPSKLGLHVIQNNDPAIMQFVRQAQPVVMKGVGDLGFLQEVKESWPWIITVGRIDDIFAQNYIGSPEEAAQEYVDKHIGTYLAHPYVDYWEGWNEPVPGMSRMSWYARFEQERVRLMAGYGLRSAIGGFPPGLPELDEFRLFVPAVATAIEYGGIMTLHEGDIETGDMRYLYGEPLPGYPAYPDRGAMAFRYRWFYREVLEPAGLVIPLVISELEFAGWDQVSVPTLMDGLAWYDHEARQDGYVIGFTVFTAGPVGQWYEFDVGPIVPQLIAYVVSQR